MKPTERRLLREIPALRSHLLTNAVLAVLAAALVIGQASLLTGVLADGFGGVLPMPLLLAQILALAGIVALRALLGWGCTALAQRAAAAVKANLRGRVLARTQRLGPVRLAGERHGELTTLVTRGLNALDPYFTGYLPKMVGSMITPLAVIGWLALVDWASALIIVVTLPLIPVFGALVGAHTKHRTARQWGLLSRLGGHFLDVVAGLPTLRAFGRAHAQADVVHEMADAHRGATMRTLRVAFLSSLVLELVATLSVALVAVPVGLRLMAGEVDLHTALLVLFLAPEAYLPLRAAGAAFHESAEGIAVAERTFAVLDSEEDEPRGSARPAEVTDVRLERVSVRYPARDSAVLSEVDLHVGEGERVALVGPSGAGKSTLLSLLLGFVPAESGRVLVGGTDLSEVDIESWRSRLAWVPQRPHLFAASVADNIRLGRPDASMEEVREAARAAGAEEFIDGLPRGFDTLLGERGTGVSTGQRQRIAIARAFVRDAPLLLLDEPTAHLDPHSESVVAEASARLMAGRTAIVIAHRPALLHHVDRIVRVSGGRVREFTGHEPAGGPVLLDSRS
ncbi:thiol reductant ABC exporter subunit CydD [Saccharopolyspora taberi]|uniref:Thiol reductant ABC exporter subunit CydD n=1 Tax=Saccharopolyspora taberi TaxID=60895 RepID=A0ABN3VG18_9PSEU